MARTLDLGSCASGSTSQVRGRLQDEACKRNDSLELRFYRGRDSQMGYLDLSKLPVPFAFKTLIY